MFTVNKAQYTAENLALELKRQSELKDAGVVWHDEYPEVLTWLEADGLTTYPSFDDLLLRIGGVLVAGYSFHVRHGATAILGAKPEFESSKTAKKFTAANWTQIGAGEDAYLQLKNNVSPHTALLDMVANARNWTFDCATFVQGVTLYATAKTLRQEKFDAQFAGKKFFFKDHDSTGLTHEKLFFRDGKSDFRLRTKKTDKAGGEPSVKVTAEQLLRIAPVGSRVTFANSDDAARGTDYERENTVALGAAKFASQPFGVNSAAETMHRLAQQTVLRYEGFVHERLDAAAAGGDTEISVAEAKKALTELDKLVKSGNTDDQVAWIFAHEHWIDELIDDNLADYIENNIYLAEVEIFNVTPENDETRKYTVQ